MSSSGFLYSSRTAGEFNSCSAEQKFSSLTQKLTLKKRKEKLAQRREKKGAAQSILFLPDLIAFVLVADGHQVQEDLVEVSKGEVYTHHCNSVARCHLRATNRQKYTEKKGI